MNVLYKLSRTLRIWLSCTIYSALASSGKQVAYSTGVSFLINHQVLFTSLPMDWNLKNLSLVVFFRMEVLKKQNSIRISMFVHCDWTSTNYISVLPTIRRCPARRSDNTHGLACKARPEPLSSVLAAHSKSWSLWVILRVNLTNLPTKMNQGDRS